MFQMSNIKNRLGEINYNECKSKMTIVEYNSHEDIVVEFENGFRVKTKYRYFKRGKVKSVYDKTLCGVGYIGEGKYKSKSNAYKIWSSIMNRVYDIEYHHNNPTYSGCSVAEEWHNFQIFAKWYDDNYYEIDGQRMQLDKDILIKGNKIYSPETCVFVPQCINLLLTKRENERGMYPIGVHAFQNRYKAQCSNGFGKQKHLGMYDTPKEAFIAYKQYKESVIREIANSYIDRIPERLYNVLMEYKVEIDD
ncbi:HNH endonuclease [Bacillus phage vB_BanS_Chewbecca]|uniref:AP2 domain-containing protein n=1 Tax=Bacillus phage vB_BanS_Chewbecca TaxID=2894786 RepID=A0AAE8YP41_9CAUD|nr:HNH endonuclease [Bacillus phage vB_BanS_Chewbecca]UGO46092.1 AP2 domain-containing protein [Bacillus phage vB_BanS_Chewbecca]